MSRTTWGVAVTALFAIVAWATPFPERWRGPLVFLAWVAFILSCIGWLFAHTGWGQRLRSNRKATHPMTLIFIGLIAGILAVTAWLLIPKESPKSEGATQEAATRQDVEEIKSLLSQPTTTRIIYEKNPGFSVQAIIRIHNLPDVRRKYFFDIANKGGGGWSIYLDEENVFTYSAFDAEGKPHTVRVQSIPRDEFIFLSCETALRDESASLRVMVDGQLVGSLDLSSKLQLASFDPADAVLGADRNGENGARFDLFSWVFYTATLTTSELEGLRDKYYKQRSIAGYAQFSGSQWMRLGKGNTPTGPTSGPSGS